MFLYNYKWYRISWLILFPGSGTLQTSWPDPEFFIPFWVWGMVFCSVECVLGIVVTMTDSLLRVRDQHDHEATAMIKAQFMQLWDGLATDNTSTVLVMGATNRPKDVDKAILRWASTTRLGQLLYPVIIAVMGIRMADNTDSALVSIWIRIRSQITVDRYRVMMMMRYSG